MFLVFCDETGDPGAILGTTPYYIITSVIVPEQCWENVFQEMKRFRQNLRSTHGIPLKCELKGHYIIGGKSDFSRVKKSALGRFTRWERLQIMREVIEFLASLAPMIEVQNICFRKTLHPKDKQYAKTLSRDRFLQTWQYSLQRLEAHVYYYENRRKGHFKKMTEHDGEFKDWACYHASNDKAIVFPDNTQNDLLRKLSRKMHAFNNVPYRGIPFNSFKPSRQVKINHVLGDPLYMESHHSYFVQFADVIGYCLSKHYFPDTIPNKFSRIGKKGNDRLGDLFPLLKPILCTRAAKDEPFGVKFIEDQQKMPPEGGINADLPRA